MKYIRTKDGIYKIDSRYNQIIEKDNKKYYINCNYENEILNQADTIEELVQDNDIIYIHDLYPDAVLVVEGNIKPFGYNNFIKLEEWLKYEFTEFDLYIKQSNGDYHKVAEKKQCGGLKLI